MDDARIIELYFARDEEAIEQTRVCYGGKLYAVAMRILEDREDAQECENDTYLKTWNSIPPNRPVHFLAYIVKICRNAALGMLEYRNAAKRSAQVVELTDEMQQCIPDALAEQAFEPEEIGHLLSAFLREQSEDNRKIFVRRYLSGESVAEVAEALGYSESKVKSSLLRTREKLRGYLQKEGVSV
ncbi:MAG: sigma-70 family RNA polymerase sigma factor [Firmicutes bacterium]|nr:sigma-70 family RNA polymerase sigma factor [Bacillota bacterium]